MAQTITVHADDMVKAAEREVETLDVAEAIKLHGRDDVVFVDLRDIRELGRDGRLPGAFHCPRGMSGSIRRASITRRNSRRTSPSFSSVPQGRAPRSPPRLRNAWACARSRISAAASALGRRLVARSRWITNRNPEYLLYNGAQ